MPPLPSLLGPLTPVLAVVCGWSALFGWWVGALGGSLPLGCQQSRQWGEGAWLELRLET